MTRRVAVNGLFVRRGQVGGAEMMLTCLLGGLDRVLTDSTDDWLVLSRDHLLPPATFGRIHERVVPVSRIQNRVALELRHIPPMRDVDCWLHPNYFTPPCAHGRIVTVIHDAQFMHYPGNFSWRKRRWLASAHRHTMRRADAVVAISQFVADDLLRIHGRQFARKVRVIPNPVDFRSPANTLEPVGLPADRSLVLCVSAHYPHKNLDTLIRAFALVAEQRSDAHLVLVGQLPAQLIGTRQRGDISSMIDQLHLRERVTVTGFVPDDTVRTLYEKATVVVAPSLFEGFGLPVPEALGRGVPVVSTNRGALAEVGMGMTVTLDEPTNPRSMANAIATVLTNPARYAPSATDREAVRQRYDPLRVAREYVELLSNL